MSKVKTEIVAKVLVINESNQALILTVGEYKERPDKSFKPDLPGGFVEQGEPERDAVIREVQEEAGFSINPKDQYLVYSETKLFADEQKSVTKLLYMTKMNHTPEVTISWEHASYEWVTTKGLAQSIEFRPFYKKALEYCTKSGLIGE